MHAEIAGGVLLPLSTAAALSVVISTSLRSERDASIFWMPLNGTSESSVCPDFGVLREDVPTCVEACPNLTEALGPYCIETGGLFHQAASDITLPTLAAVGTSAAAGCVAGVAYTALVRTAGGAIIICSALGMIASVAYGGALLIWDASDLMQMIGWIVVGAAALMLCLLVATAGTLVLAAKIAHRSAAVVMCRIGPTLLAPVAAILRFALAAGWTLAAATVLADGAIVHGQAGSLLLRRVELRDDALLQPAVLILLLGLWHSTFASHWLQVTVATYATPRLRDGDDDAGIGVTRAACVSIRRHGAAIATGSLTVAALRVATLVSHYARQRVDGLPRSSMLLRALLSVVSYCTSLCATMAQLILPYIYAAMPLHGLHLCGAARLVGRVTGAHPVLVGVVTVCVRLLTLLHVIHCAAAGVAVATLLGATMLVQIVLCAATAVAAGGILGLPLFTAMRVALLAQVGGEGFKQLYDNFPATKPAAGEVDV